MDIRLEDLISGDLLEQIKNQEEDLDMAPAVMPVGGVLLIEMLHDDGLKYLHFCRPSDTTAWQAVGICRTAEAHYARMMEDG